MLTVGLLTLRAIPSDGDGDADAKIIIHTLTLWQQCALLLHCCCCWLSHDSIDARASELTLTDWLKLMASLSVGDGDNDTVMIVWWIFYWQWWWWWWWSLRWKSKFCCPYHCAARTSHSFSFVADSICVSGRQIFITLIDCVSACLPENVFLSGRPRFGPNRLQKKMRLRWKEDWVLLETFWFLLITLIHRAVPLINPLRFFLMLCVLQHFLVEISQLH